MATHKKRVAKPPADNDQVTLQVTRREIRILRDALALVTTYPSILAETYTVPSGAVAACLNLQQTLANVD